VAQPMRRELATFPEHLLGHWAEDTRAEVVRVEEASRLAREDERIAPENPGGHWVRWLVDPASGNRVMQVRSTPNSWAPAHWHLSDTVNIVTQGESIVEGDPPHRAGDLRWVRGGFAYGPERSGPEVCEYLFFSLGPYDKLDPDVAAPPLGRWDDPSTWIEGYPQVERHRRLREDL